MEYAKTIEGYLSKHPNWQDELQELRDLLARTELNEEIKWGAPAYTLNGKNIIGIGAFKNHLGVWFHQGVFLKDVQNKLVNAQEGKTKALRQWRLEKGEAIEGDLLMEYVQEAIENSLAGKEVKPERKKGVRIPPELEAAFEKNDPFKKAFHSLTPGKQREYAGYIVEAKREATKVSRLEKITPMVLEGVGLHDKYKNC
ncbi:MAG: YdeI/OmpD-associated family protein [Flavobacteriaceae bacterium]|nr:YdeI/OmpD-associated family protein [Flavobacteriaceae bacterium]